MINGFEMCDNHTYLFATEGKDCPYCEIDRLKAELAEARSSGYWYERYKSCAEHLHLYTDGEEHGTADSCSFCTVVAEINGKLTEVQRQLAEAKEREDVDSMRIHLFDEEVQCLRKYLAEARSDVRIEKKISAGLQDRIGIAYDTARQEVARSIIQIISRETVDRPFEQSQAAEIIKAKFKLEG